MEAKGYYREKYLLSFGIGKDLIDNVAKKLEQQRKELLERRKKEVRSDLEDFAKDIISGYIYRSTFEFATEEKSFLHKLGIRATREYLRIKPDSLYEILEEDFDPRKIIEALNDQFECYINIFIQKYDFKKNKEEKIKRIQRMYPEEIKNYSIDKLINSYLECEENWKISLDDIESILHEKKRLFGYDFIPDLELSLKEKMLNGFNRDYLEPIEYFDKLHALIKKFNIQVFLCKTEREWLAENPNFTTFLSALDHEEEIIQRKNPNPSSLEQLTIPFNLSA